jgi:hypothetical protein
LIAYELEIIFNEEIENNEEQIFDTINKNPYAMLIDKMYSSFVNVYGFYAAYIEELIRDDELMITVVENIEPCLLELASCKIEVDEALASNFIGFKHKVMKDYENWIAQIKDRAFRSGTPLKVELMHIVYGSHDELGHEAETESLGFNSSRIHPDIYINELLVGMRTIHQVLPAIMKKLGIYDEFKLDTSDLHIAE